MLSIGITSNLKKYFKGYIDFIDHYWLDFFEKNKIKFYLIPNKKNLSKFFLKKINFLILTGGNDVIGNEKTSKIRNKIESHLIDICVKKKIPMLGICRGAQLLNLKFGGRVKKVKNQMRTRHDIYFIKNSLIKKKFLNVNSFHNYGIKKNGLAKKFEILAFDKSKNIEMFISKNNKIIGTMWHPEREKNKKLLIYFINFLSKS